MRKKAKPKPHVLIVEMLDSQPDPFFKVFRIKYQSHRLVEFSPLEEERQGLHTGSNGIGSTKCYFKSENGVRLGSLMLPCVSFAANNMYVYLRGHLKDEDHSTLSIPNRRVKQFLEAVEEYNAFHKERGI